jgi:hypothetical protein
MSPWIDESAADARWNIEDLSTPFDPTQPAPTPPSGTKYLRVNRPTDTSGLLFYVIMVSDLKYRCKSFYL